MILLPPRFGALELTVPNVSLEMQPSPGSQFRKRSKEARKAAKPQKIDPPKGLTRFTLTTAEPGQVNLNGVDIVKIFPGFDKQLLQPLEQRMKQVLVGNPSVSLEALLKEINQPLTALVQAIPSRQISSPLLSLLSQPGQLFGYLQDTDQAFLSVFAPNHRQP